MKNKKTNLCKCGCGGYCEKNYLKGHGRKGKKCSDEHKRKISEANKGRIVSEGEKERLRNLTKGRKHSEETKKKQSRIAKEKGFGLWMEGRKLSDSTVKKMSESNKGRVVTEETRKKISIANSGKKNGMYGKTHSDEYKERLSNELKGRTLKNAHTPEAIEKMRLKQIGKTHLDETKKKMRISKIKFIKSVNDGVCPMHNVKGCEYLDNLSKEKGWNLKHALNGGEFHIPNLGYFVDGYDKEKNIVVEYDEPLHYFKNGKLKNKDIIRQKEIIEELSCKFFRYNEKEELLYEI